MIIWDGEEAKLNEFDKDEWWEVCQALRPDLTREEFEAMWVDFTAGKCRRTLH